MEQGQHRATDAPDESRQRSALAWQAALLLLTAYCFVVAFNFISRPGGNLLVSLTYSPLWIATGALAGAFNEKQTSARLRSCMLRGLLAGYLVGLCSSVLFGPLVGLMVGLLG